MKARTTGKGSVVDAAIVDGSAHMMNLLMSLRAVGSTRTERGRGLLDGPHWSRTYQCADDLFLSVQCLEPKFYRIFLERLGLESDAAFAQQFEESLWQELCGRLETLFASHSRAHWLSLFEGSDACVGPVLPPEEAMTDPHMAARGVWQSHDNRLQAAAAPRFDGKKPATAPSSPFRGQHTDEILEEIKGDHSAR